MPVARRGVFIQVRQGRQSAAERRAPAPQGRESVSKPSPAGMGKGGRSSIRVGPEGPYATGRGAGMRRAAARSVARIARRSEAAAPGRLHGPGRPIPGAAEIRPLARAIRVADASRRRIHGSLTLSHLLSEPIPLHLPPPSLSLFASLSLPPLPPPSLSPGPRGPGGGGGLALGKSRHGPRPWAPDARCGRRRRAKLATAWHCSSLFSIAPCGRRPSPAGGRAYSRPGSMRRTACVPAASGGRRMSFS